MLRVNNIKEMAETIEESTEKSRFVEVQSNELKSCLMTLEKEKKQLADDYDELKKVTSCLQQEREKMKLELYSELCQEVSFLAKEIAQASKKVKATFKAIPEDNRKDLHNDAHKLVTELSNKAKEINHEVCELNCNFLVPDEVKECLEKLEEHKNLLDKNLKLDSAVFLN